MHRHRFLTGPSLCAVTVAMILATAAAAAGDPASGRTKAKQCVNCHGLDGVSRLPDAPHLSG